MSDTENERPSLMIYKTRHLKKINNYLGSSGDNRQVVTGYFGNNNGALQLRKAFYEAKQQLKDNNLLLNDKLYRDILKLSDKLEKILDKSIKL